MSQSLSAQAVGGGGFLFPLKPGELKRKKPPVLGNPSRAGRLLPQGGALLPCRKAAGAAGSAVSPRRSLCRGSGCVQHRWLQGTALGGWESEAPAVGAAFLPCWGAALRRRYPIPSVLLTVSPARGRAPRGAVVSRSPRTGSPAELRGLCFRPEERQGESRGSGKTRGLGRERKQRPWPCGAGKPWVTPARGDSLSQCGCRAAACTALPPPSPVCWPGLPLLAPF